MTKKTFNLGDAIDNADKITALLCQIAKTGEKYEISPIGLAAIMTEAVSIQINLILENLSAAALEDKNAPEGVEDFLLLMTEYIKKANELAETLANYCRIGG